MIPECPINRARHDSMTGHTGADTGMESLGSQWKSWRWFWVSWCTGRSVSRSWAGNSGRRNPVTLATLFPSGEKNEETGRTVPTAGALRQEIGPPPVLAWARPEIAPSTNGEPLNSRGWKKNARSLLPPSANSRNSWKISATPGIARSSSGSWMRIETGKPRPGNRAKSCHRRRLTVNAVERSGRVNGAYAPLIRIRGR